MLQAYLLLVAAIVVEVAATSALPRTNGFRSIPWTSVVIGGYAFAIWLMSLVVRTLSVSVTYAIWSGAGTAAIAVVGATLLGERWDGLKVLGVGLIIAGVVIVNMRAA